MMGCCRSWMRDGRPWWVLLAGIVVCGWSFVGGEWSSPHGRCRPWVGVVRGWVVIVRDRGLSLVGVGVGAVIRGWVVIVRDSRLSLVGVGSSFVVWNRHLWVGGGRSWWEVFTFPGLFRMESMWNPWNPSGIPYGIHGMNIG